MFGINHKPKEPFGRCGFHAEVGDAVGNDGHLPQYRILSLSPLLLVRHKTGAPVDIKDVNVSSLQIVGEVVIRKACEQLKLKHSHADVWRSYIESFCHEMSVENFVDALRNGDVCVESMIELYEQVKEGRKLKARGQTVIGKACAEMSLEHAPMEVWGAYEAVYGNDMTADEFVKRLHGGKVCVKTMIASYQKIVAGRQQKTLEGTA